MSSPFDSAGTADTWDALDQLIDELVRWSRSTATPATFYRELLRRTVEALAAQRAAVWEVVEGDFVWRAGVDEAGRPAEAPDARKLDALQAALRWTTRRGEPLALAPGSHAGDDGLPDNPTDALLLLQPFSVDGAALGAIVIEQRPTLTPEGRHGALRFLATVGDLTADYHRNRQRLLFQERAEATDDLETLLTALYADIDLRRTAYAAANEGRRWCGVDRVSVLLCAGKQTQTLCVSGVAQVDRRAESMRRLERLAALVVAGKRPLRHPDDSAPRAPLVAQALADYVEVAEARELDMVLLEANPPAERTASSTADALRPPRMVGVLVLEQFTGVPRPDNFTTRVETLRRHASAALDNAADVASIPLSRTWRSLRRERDVYRRRLGKAAWIFGAAVLLIGATFLIPAPLTVEAPGVMQPRERRELFAPLDGIVDQVLVQHGQSVAKDDTLLRLRKPELEIELTRVLGELQTSQSRLAGLRANRTTSPPATPVERRRQQELTAEEEQLKLSLAALEEELGLLRKQQAELVVRAPLAGTVTTWDVDRLLTGRPVARGQLLLEVADDAGPWVLELEIPDKRFGEVTAAQRNAAAPLAVEFIPATRPELSYSGRLTRVAQAAETERGEGTRVAATVDFPREDVVADVRRPGAAVTAKIACGPSSLGYVWTRDLIHYVRTQWLF